MRVFFFFCVASGDRGFWAGRRVAQSGGKLIIGNLFCRFDPYYSLFWGIDNFFGFQELAHSSAWSASEFWSKGGHLNLRSARV